MSEDVEDVEGTRRLVLTHPLVVQKAAGFLERFKQHLSEANSIEVDLGRVEEIDSAGIQLLLALRKQADKDGVDLRITQATEPVLKALRLYDVESVVMRNGPE